MYNRAKLKLKAKEKIKGHIGIFLLCFLLYLGIVLPLSLLQDWIEQKHPLTGVLFSFIAGCIQSLLVFGVAVFTLYFVRNNQTSLSYLFAGFQQQYWLKVLLVGLLKGICVLAGMLLFIVPGIIIALGLSQTDYILYDNPEMSVVDILRKSWNMMNGYKGKLLVLELSFIGWGLLCILTLGLAMIYVFPYYQTTRTLFYEFLKEVQG